jgi:hypothetical protein
MLVDDQAIPPPDDEPGTIQSAQSSKSHRRRKAASTQSADETNTPTAGSSNPQGRQASDEVSVNIMILLFLDP